MIHYLYHFDCPPTGTDEPKRVKRPPGATLIKQPPAGTKLTLAEQSDVLRNKLVNMRAEKQRGETLHRPTNRRTPSSATSKSSPWPLNAKSTGSVTLRPPNSSTRSPMAKRGKTATSPSRLHDLQLHTRRCQRTSCLSRRGSPRALRRAQAPKRHRRGHVQSTKPHVRFVEAQEQYPVA